MNIADDITKLIGGTPLVRLRALSERSGATIVGKLESFNPGGSVKDRIGLAMIDAAEQAGAIAPGRTTIVEPTSGNTGIALAMMAAARGYRLVLTMPETFSVERRNLLRAYGAELVLTPGSEGMRGAIDRAGELVAETRRRLHAAAVREPGQPRRPPGDDRRGDLARHRRRGRRLRGRRGHRRHGHRRGAGAQGAQARGQGLRGRAGRVARPVGRLSPGRTASRASARASCRAVLDTGVYDEIVQVAGDKAFETARALAADEGILVGISAGANAFAAGELGARPENRGKLIVTMLCDTGERYLSTPLFADQGAPAMTGG